MDMEPEKDILTIIEPPIHFSATARELRKCRMFQRFVVFYLDLKQSMRCLETACHFAEDQGETFVVDYAMHTALGRTVDSWIASAVRKMNQVLNPRWIFHRFEQLMTWLFHISFRLWPPTLFCRWSLDIQLAIASLALALFVDVYTPVENTLITLQADDRALTDNGDDLDEDGDERKSNDNDASINRSREHVGGLCNDGIGRNVERFDDDQHNYKRDDNDCDRDEPPEWESTGQHESVNIKNKKYNLKHVLVSTLTLVVMVLRILKSLLTFAVFILYHGSDWFHQYAGLKASETEEEQNERLGLYSHLLDRDLDDRLVYEMQNPLAPDEWMFDRILSLHLAYLSKFLGNNFGMERPVQIARNLEKRTRLFLCVNDDDCSIINAQCKSSTPCSERRTSGRSKPSKSPNTCDGGKMQHCETDKKHPTCPKHENSPKSPTSAKSASNKQQIDPVQQSMQRITNDDKWKHREIRTVHKVGNKYYLEVPERSEMQMVKRSSIGNIFSKKAKDKKFAEQLEIPSFSQLQAMKKQRQGKESEILSKDITPEFHELQSRRTLGPQKDDIARSKGETSSSPGKSLAGCSRSPRSTRSCQLNYETVIYSPPSKKYGVSVIMRQDCNIFDLGHGYEIPNDEIHRDQSKADITRQSIPEEVGGIINQTATESEPSIQNVENTPKKNTKPQLQKQESVDIVSEKEVAEHTQKFTSVKKESTDASVKNPSDKSSSIHKPCSQVINIEESVQDVSSYCDALEETNSNDTSENTDKPSEQDDTVAGPSYLCTASPAQAQRSPVREFCGNPGEECRSVYETNQERSSDVDTGVATEDSSA